MNRPRLLTIAWIPALLIAACSGQMQDLDKARPSPVQQGAGSPGGGNAGTESAPGSPGADRALAALGGSPYPGKPVYYVGNRPVTGEELVRYHARMLATPAMTTHGVKYNADNVARSFAIYWVLAARAVDAGLAESPEVRGLVELYRDSALANEYRAHLEKTTPVPGDELKRMMPSEWTRIDFGVQTFPSGEEAEAFYEETLRKRKELGEDAFRKYADQKFTRTTGSVFRGSGFFDPFEEPYLFSLKAGEVSRPVATGIGVGVCYARVRQEMDRDAIDRYVADLRKKIVSREVEKRLNAIIARQKYDIAEDNVAQSAVAEARSGLHSDLVVLALQPPGGGAPLRVRYRDLRSLTPVNYRPIFTNYPQESWAGFVVQDLRNLASHYAVGEEAKREGIRLSNDWEKEIFDFRVKTLYLAELARMNAQAPASVTEEEARGFYNKNRGLFTLEESIKVSYVYSPEREGLERLLRQAGTPENIFQAKEFRDVVKRNTVYAGEKTYEGIYRKVREMAIGGISGIVRGEMGFYIVRLDGKTEKGFQPFEETRERIREYLAYEKKQEKVRERINEEIPRIPLRKA